MAVFCLDAPAVQVRMTVYTTAYRRVGDRTVRNIPAGVRQEPLPVTDLKGRPLANGLYYVVIGLPSGPVIAKWMILR